MRITEIFHSIQGESSHAGKPCIFVRLTGCSLRCVWCDTKYSYTGGMEMSFDDVMETIASYPTRLVEITGGEPLEQDDVYTLMDLLLAKNYIVMLESGGHIAVDRVPKAVIKIIDVKCPDSGEAETFCPENIELAQEHDEFKFVIASRKDYEWSRSIVKQKFQGKPNTILFSPAHGELDPKILSEWVLSDGLPVRVQLQLHKYIWGADMRGV